MGGGAPTGIPIGDDEGLCETASSWRLLCWRGLHLGFAHIERFNRSYRTEVLNAHLFESLAEVRALTECWLVVYNQERPHDSLGRVPPLMFLPRPNTPMQALFGVST